jgi:hypothetical protein
MAIHLFQVNNNMIVYGMSLKKPSKQHKTYWLNWYLPLSWGNISRLYLENILVKGQSTIFVN